MHTRYGTWLLTPLMQVTFSTHAVLGSRALRYTETGPSDDTVKALSLISRNPELEQLMVNHYHIANLKPFPQDILTALSLHQSLRRMYLHPWVPWKTFGAILSHLPRMLQELEISYAFDDVWDEEDVHVPAIELTHSTQLRQFVSRGRTVSPDRHLIPLLKQSPWLEEIILDEVFNIHAVTTVIAESCPRLKSFDLKVTASNIHSVDTLIRAYPMGLRSVIFGSHRMSLSGEPYDRSIVDALLMHSANTLEVLKVCVAVHGVVRDIAAVLEGFPNLKELDVPCESFLLDDIVRQTSWSESLWETDPSTGSTESSLVLPWACSKLESLYLSIGETRWDWNVPVGWLPEFQQKDVKEEEAISVARKIGVFWNTLKSLKSIYSWSMNWGYDLRATLETMSFERGVFYMKQIGLPEMTQQEAVWMGLEWTSIADRLKSEETTRLDWASCHHRSGFARYHEDASDENQYENQDGDQGENQSENQGEDQEQLSEMDCEFSANNKRIHKSVSWYSRRSSRGSASWFET
ncbi:hypothetical protein BGX34_003712 [Mortierella sp. NVP85]|nr:hypothetical protein BGX34_003712 [Mortierella sp. NVP85]